MFKSIRWSLQLWHAGLLAAVLAAFGTVSYYGISRAQYEQVDNDLERLVHIVEGGIRPDGLGGGRGRGFGQGRGGPRGEFDRGHSPDNFGKPPFEGRGGPGRGGENPADMPALDAAHIDLPPAAAQQFGDEPGMAYYVMWNRDGKLLTSLGAPPDVPDLGAPSSPVVDPPNTQTPVIRERGEYREAILYGRFGDRILAGRSILAEQNALHRDVILLAFAGAGVLFVGLVGGWMLSLGVVKPILAITQTAQEISASNLSKRIDVAGTQSELGNLATVLNDTFSRLDAAFQQQVRFTADASHELRTPLSVIHTNAQLALSRDRSVEEYRKAIATCLRASTRMKGLVDSLLLLAGTDAGRLSLDRHPFDLSNIVEECVGMVAPQATEKKVTVESNLQPLDLTADPTRIAQVVTNLLTNAIRYNREGGTVRVSVQTEGNDAVITVADTGVGIPIEHQPHLFERFYRVDVARSRDVGGNGLGLAICKSIVDAHGGSISFQSEVDKGTTFTVRLPRNPSQPETA